jgi:hypothetical protein
MYFEVLGHLINTRRQDRDLYLWRTGICSVNTVVRNNFFFLFNSQCHACKSPAFLFLSEYKEVLHVRIITWIAQGRNELPMPECRYICRIVSPAMPVRADGRDTRRAHGKSGPYTRATVCPPGMNCQRGNELPEGHDEAGSSRLLSQTVAFSATAIELVRGVLVTAHVFINERLDERALWRIYREAYQREPFIRLVKERSGVYRYPEPKILAGSNFCDVGFALDVEQQRVVVISALDNLMKGAAGNGVQALNCMFGWDETLGLTFPGLHPV